MAIFTPVDRPLRLPEEVASSLNAAIAEGRLRPGDRLPAEQTLARDFGVARTVVREAIAQLKYDGMILSRQGVGAFVAPPEARTAFRISPACFAKRQELLKLLQLRTTVMADAAGLAAASRSPAELAALQAAFSDMQEAQADEVDGPERRVDAEARFYATVAEASDNEYFVGITAMIDGQVLGNLRSVAVKNAKAAEWSAKVLAEHEQVLLAITAQDSAAAATAARAHFERAAARLARRADIADV